MEKRKCDFMEKYVPDIYQKSIYTIDYDKLKLRGIKCLLFDLDNTLSPINLKVPSQKLKDLFLDLKDKGFTLIIFSNSLKRRVKPFKEGLEVDACAMARKPKSEKFLKVLAEYHFKDSEVAIIGDQILTDVVGGNKVGITTILVNPISNKDGFYTKINRYFENRVLRELRDRDLFTKGRYYE